MKTTENDGLLDGIDDEPASEVPAGLIGVLLLAAAALIAAALIHFGLR